LSRRREMTWRAWLLWHHRLGREMCSMLVWRGTNERFEYYFWSLGAWEMENGYVKHCDARFIVQQ
jgi:hypothetical protein